jgi:hypothetical protein
LNAGPQPRRRALLALAACAAVPGAITPAHAASNDAIDVIARVKRSVVAVGTFARGRTPGFQFRGTGFAIGTGATIATNAHVLPATLDAARNETLAILVPGAHPDDARVRDAQRATRRGLPSTRRRTSRCCG